MNIKQEATPSDVAIFKASTGPEGLEIRCENDWFNHNGRIKLTIGNVDGGTPTSAAKQSGKRENRPGVMPLGLWKRSFPILIKLAKQDQQKERWGRVWEDPLCRKYKRPEHEDFWIWNYDFYNAPVEDLRYILKLVEG